MNKTYISSLLVVLLAGAQVTQAVEESELDALMAGAETEAMAAAPVEQAKPATVEGSATVDMSSSSIFERGVQFYKNGDYNLARVNFEAVLAAEPYNRKAMNYLKRISDKVAALDAHKRDTARSDAMVKVADKWNPDYTSSLIAVGGAEVVPPKKDDDPGVKKMVDHLKQLTIPSLDFRDANIKDVVLFLTETCRRMDTSGKGINMILLGLESSDAMGTDEGNNITISIRDLSLYDSLQVITEMASLKFVVEPNMVLVMPADYVRAVEVESATFGVIPEVGEELASMGGGGDSGGSVDDLFGGGDTSSSSSESGPVDVSGYFSIVSWPKGSQAMYYPNFRKLIVQNTRENIAKVSKIVGDLEDEAIRRRSSQVQIEAKFVEFSEGALDELGFDWNLYGTGSVGGMKFNKAGQTYTPVSGYAESVNTVYAVSGAAPSNKDLPSHSGTLSGSSSKVYTDALSGYTAVGTGGQSLFGGNQRSNLSAFESYTSGILANMGGVPAAMLFTDGTVDLRITAMQQEGTADVLSAPKVTTQSGYEAVIRVTEIHRFPQDWDVETGQRTAPVVKPQDWEDFDLGVVLRVTPEVDADNNTIKLELNPEIRKFLGYDGYHVADNAYDAGTSTTEVPRGDGTELYAEMPYFETRSVQTRVTVADGSTVMMGGLVDETTETFRDQVPILGDIPYIGRLFRSEGTRSAKKNLVIFVKATQVDEMGMTRNDRELAARAAK